MQPPIELEIQDLARGGAGVGRDASGRVIFVPFTAPGDRVRVQVVEQKKQHYAHGKLLEILRPSEIRQKPLCSVFGQCGGCQWQHIPYSLQWKTKSGGVLQALARVGIATDFGDRCNEFPAEEIWEYRNRIQLRGLGNRVGFFAAGSHEIVGADRCAIARPEINSIWEQIRKEGAALAKPFKVEVAVDPDGSVQRIWNSSHGAAGFRQIHDAQNGKLQKWILNALPSGRALLDLYGGGGNLSRAFADRVPVIHCVDFGAQPPVSAGLPQNLYLHRSRVLPWLKKAAADPQIRSGAPWVAISDPPRGGLGREFPEIADALNVIGVKELVAVGCDPDSWARDLAGFLKCGWVLEQVAVFDFFPQTPHVEAVALLKFD
ncbi:MAG: hypothetical protein A2X97_03765 [Bdellovibrionales bacterium GWA1_52_35]|nr:MAG: hypothetical protein A2X97_03765 [Bdellovibrionales bacterium GWA1_52_35]